MIPYILIAIFQSPEGLETMNVEFSTAAACEYAHTALLEGTEKYINTVNVYAVCTPKIVLEENTE